jgi:hypothetical protein
MALPSSFLSDSTRLATAGSAQHFKIHAVLADSRKTKPLIETHGRIRFEYMKPDWLSCRPGSIQQLLEQVRAQSQISERGQ